MLDLIAQIWEPPNLANGGGGGTTPPTIQASALVITGKTPNTALSFQWTNGNGSSRIVLMKAVSAVDSDPVDGTGYTANSLFGSGSQIGSGNYVVNIGNGPVTVTGLTAGVIYYIAIYEFNGSGSTTNYLQASPLTGNSDVIDLTGITTNVVLGDSYGVGLNAPGNNGYAPLFSTANALTLNNQSGSGKGIWREQANFQGLAFSRTTTLIMVLIGLNDIRQGGSGAKTLKKLEAGMRCIILKCIGLAISAAGSSGVTRSGTWAGYTGNTFGGLFPTGTAPGDFAMSSSTALDYLQWTFTGTAFGFQCFGSDGVVATYGTIKVYIDGVLVDTQSTNNWYDGISDGTYDNKRGPIAFSYHGLSNTSHTIKIEGQGDGLIAVDFFTTISPVGNEAKLLVGEIPYLSAAGYAMSPSNGSIGASDAGTAVYSALITTHKALGFAMTLAPINTANGGLFTNSQASGDLSSDDIHPTGQGHGNITTSFNNKIIIVYPTIAAATTNADGTHIYLIYNLTLANIIPANGDFTLSGGKTVTGVARTGLNNNIIDLTISSAYSSGDTITVSYTPGTNQIQNSAGRVAAALTNRSVGNFILTNTKSVTFPAANTVPITAVNPTNLGTSNGTVDNTQGFTICLNLKFVDNTTYSRFVQMGKNTGAAPQILEIRADTTTKKLNFIIYTDNTNYKSWVSTAALTESVWQKLIISYSPANGQHLYKNNSGEISAVAINGGSYTAMTAVGATTVLAIGGNEVGALPATLSEIDEVIFIDKELTSLERDEYWAGGVSAGNMLNASFASHVRGYWRFESNLNDSSSSAYTLTSSVAPTYNADVP